MNEPAMNAWSNRAFLAFDPAHSDSYALRPDMSQFSMTAPVKTHAPHWTSWKIEPKKLAFMNVVPSILNSTVGSFVLMMRNE